MLDYESSWVGWNKSGNSDKIWGYHILDDIGTLQFSEKFNCVIFWGRRGSKLQTKLIKTNRYDLRHMSLSKVDRGYNSVDIKHYDSLYDDFSDDLEKVVLWAKLRA